MLVWLKPRKRMPLNWNACRMKRRVWSEKKTAHAGVPIVSGTEVLTESRLKLEKKKLKI